MSDYSNQENSQIGFWKNALGWLRAVDEAFDRNPVEDLQSRIHILEARLQKIDANDRT